MVTARLSNAPQSAGLPGLAGLAISKTENYYYFNNKSASPTSPAASWPHISCQEILHFPTHGQLLTVSAMRCPACLLGRPYFCENAMMSCRALPPRLAYGTVLRHLDIKSYIICIELHVHTASVLSFWLYICIYIHTLVRMYMHASSQERSHRY